MADDTFIERLRADIELEEQMLIDVTDFTAPIREVNDQYKERRRSIRSGLKALGLDDPNEWPDLCLWYGRYSDDQSLATNQARREFVIRTYQPLLDALENLADRRLGTGIDVPETGWTEVDRQIRQLREAYARADTPEQFRQVGLLCRDIFLSLGHVIFDPEKHLPDGQSMPKRDDAKARLELAVRAEYSGSQNERLRALIVATWSFVQPRVHDQTDDRTNAMIAADSTIHLVKVLTALFPTPTGRPPEADEYGHESESEWSPDADDLDAYLEWLAEDEA